MLGGFINGWDPWLRCCRMIKTTRIYNLSDSSRNRRQLRRQRTDCALLWTGQLLHEAFIGGLQCCDGLNVLCVGRRKTGGLALCGLRCTVVVRHLAFQLNLLMHARLRLGLVPLLQCAELQQHRN